MNAITYKTDCVGVDWAAMRQALIDDDFHNGRTAAQYRISFENSAHICIAYADEQIIGTVRALSDHVCNAYIVDVWTHSAYRKRGIATHMMTTVMEQLAGQHIHLFTEDAVGFYEKLGFAVQELSLGKVGGVWLHNDSRSEA